MLNTILKSVGPGCPKVLPNWDKAVMMISLRTELMKTRFLGTGFFYSNGMNMLKHILMAVVDYDMMELKSDFQRYVMKVDPVVPSFRVMYDPISSSRVSKNLFTTNPNTLELIMNVSMETPLTDLPMDQSWEHWKDLCPIHVIYHDSRELVSNIYRFSIDFKYDNPNCIIYSIDLNVIIMMYAKYLDFCKSTGLVGTVEDFLQNHIVIKWFDDLRRIWLTNILKDIVKEDFDPERYSSDEFVAPKTVLKTLAVDLRRLLEDAKHKNVSIGDFCRTKWFGEYSLKYWLDELNKNIRVPSLRQYKWVEFIATLPYAGMILDTMLKMGRQETNLLTRSLLFDLHQYRNQNICSNIHNLQYRQICQNELDRLINNVTNINRSV